MYNTLGHENWSPRCLNDEMAHQRDWGLRSTLLVTERSPPSKGREGMINTVDATELLLNIKWSFGEMFRFEHEPDFVVWEFMWQTCKERPGPEKREVVARHQSYFCLSKFRSGPVTLEAARVFHIAQRLGRPLQGQSHWDPLSLHCITLHFLRRHFHHPLALLYHGCVIRAVS